ncbi:MAG: DUF928 domain-containing protein [Geitlerinemataceae cyanobacterium]
MTVIFCLELGLTPTRLSSVKAEVVSSSSNPVQSTTPIIRFMPPEDDGDPLDTASGGTRGHCPQTPSTTTQEMAALIPETNRGLTLKSHPTFFFYVPPTSTPALLFTLKDENDSIHYQKVVPLSETQGIVSIDLPMDELPLEIDKTYQWFAIALCQYDENQPNSDSEFLYSLNNPWVQGWVRRVEPSPHLNLPPEREASLELAAVYADNGIWFDTLAILAELRHDRPQNSTLAREWETLLNSIGLEAISSQPLVD